jgi:AcrR family transcriptional regulator
MDPAPAADRRVRRSHRLMGDALLALIVEKGYDAITIKDITDRADVAYVTFFRHFKDKDELLLLRLEEELAGLRARAEHAARAVGTAGEEQAAGQAIFEYVWEKQVLYRALFGSQGTTWRVRQTALKVIAAVFLESCSPLHQPGLIPAELAANHMAAALLALIDWWLYQPTRASAEQIADIYERLIVSATLQARGQLALTPAEPAAPNRQAPRVRAPKREWPRG